MTIRFDTETRNQVANHFNELFSGGQLRIYSGGQPSDPNAAPTGDLLCTVAVPDPAFGEAVSGEVTQLQSWAGEITASGTAGWFRLVGFADAVIDGAVSELSAGGDLQLDNISLSADDAVIITDITLTQPSE